MIPTRQSFLTTFFASLEANGVRYCLLRNYHDLYADADTDVDLMVSEYSLERFERCLRTAAELTGFHFVHSARYVNYSHVFWHPRAGFIRIDFETDVRWRLFTVLSARELLDRRQRHQEFFIPHPEDESVVLFVTALWRGLLSERYRKQLAALYAACPDPASLRQTLGRAFGAAGETLADFQAQAATGRFDRKLVTRVRLSLVFQAHWRWWRWKALVRNTVSDVIRLGNRVRQPAGVSLLFVSANERPRNFDDLMRRINFLFPPKKCIIQSFDITAQATPRARWSLRLRWLRLRTLFKGGLFVRAYRLARDADLPKVVSRHARYWYPGRTFVCGEDSAGRLYFAHVSTGFMTASAPQETAAGQDFSGRFVKFISDILERSSGPIGADTRQRGMFCVLVGLDGAGKTTLARNLCDVSVAGGNFHGVRYFHWRPKIFRRVELPLPEFQNRPRKLPLPHNFWNALLSAGRLAKNAALIQLAWRLHVRPLLERGYLVLVDRYCYNYQLDPASVKYAGPPWLLALALKWFPRPDAVIALRAPREVLRQRKQELSDAEILRQTATLDAMPFNARWVVRADASLPAEELARKTMTEIIKAAAGV
jgi:thymidylate kinase